MKCQRHNKEVTALCNACNAGVCKTCTEATSALHDIFGTLCIPCYIKALNTSLEDSQSKKSSLLKFIIINCILYSLGVFLAVAAFLDPSDFATDIGYAIFFCGIYNAFSGWKKAEQAHNEYEEEHGATYTVTEDGVYRKDGFFMKLIVAIISIPLGIIITPIRVVKNSFELKKTNQCIKQFKEEIARVELL